MAAAETFVEGDHVVYPTHGVGKVERIATEEIAGHKLELIHITFEENRMTLRVPVAKARTAGLRKLASRDMFDKAMDVLRGRARIKRTMWSRRAQEYEAKINSGDPLSIAEVVRDLHRNAGQPDQSFSERQIYEVGDGPPRRRTGRPRSHRQGDGGVEAGGVPEDGLRHEAEPRRYSPGAPAGNNGSPSRTMTRPRLITVRRDGRETIASATVSAATRTRSAVQPGARP